LESRLIIDGATGARANLALEEALLTENRALTLRLWGNERSVIVGRGQLARFETDLDRCAREGIPVVRRVTAGGAVYNGPGNINWSIFVGRDFCAGGIGYRWGVREVFRMAGNLVVRAADACGVKIWLDEPNRLLSEQGKVSGMAAYIARAGLLCHGTLLLDADLSEVASLTQPADMQLERRYTRSRPMAVANTGIVPDAFIAWMRTVLEEETGLEIEQERPTDAERGMMEGLLPKYSDPAWNLGDPFAGGTG
jgi:lipoate-protein ligase A